MGHAPADDDGADDVAVSAYFLASSPPPPFHSFCVFFVCAVCAFLEKFAPGHFHFNVISFKFIVNGTLCFAFALLQLLLLQLQLLLHNRVESSRVGMFMHAARFLDLSCCRLNANGTFFDFDSKNNEWPRQAAFDDLLPVARAGCHKLALVAHSTLDTHTFTVYTHSHIEKRAKY